MDTFHRLISPLVRWSGWLGDPDFNPLEFIVSMLIAGAAIGMLYLAVHSDVTYAGVIRLPGEDASDKLEAAGTLLHILDTGVFKWGARIFAGLCIMSSAWALKEQRFGIAVICVVGAIIFGTAPKWVKNIFDIGDNQSLFSQVEDSGGRVAAPQFRPVERAIANV
jgi:hypothetical protein